MRNIYKYGILGISLMILNSCIDTLDTRPTTSFDDETVWAAKPPWKVLSTPPMMQ